MIWKIIWYEMTCNMISEKTLCCTIFLYYIICHVIMRILRYEQSLKFEVQATGPGKDSSVDHDVTKMNFHIPQEQYRMICYDLIQWRCMTFFKSVSQIRWRGRGLWKFWQLSIYIVLHVPWCTITSHNKAHAYSNGNAIKISRNMIQGGT
jgi:hypothetical protein